MDLLIDIWLLSLLVTTALVVARQGELLPAVMLFGIYSLLSASLFVVLDAVDVAFTEAAVGAGVSTILMLGGLALTGSKPTAVPYTRRILAIIVVALVGSGLIYGTLDMPFYGDPNAPIHGHVVPRYLQMSIAETTVPNVVTSVLASYRGYDTLGETTVIFTAALAVYGLMSHGATRAIPRGDMAHHSILRVVSKLMVPLILLFALYVQFHGDFGPGGGFQAGVIFAAGFILYGLTFGLDNVRRITPVAWLRRLVATGVLIYAGVGIVNLVLGGHYLDYNTLAHDGPHGQHLGIFLVELGVGTTVSAAMILLYYGFAGYRDRAQ